MHKLFEIARIRHIGPIFTLPVRIEFRHRPRDLRVWVIDVGDVDLGVKSSRDTAGDGELRLVIVPLGLVRPVSGFFDLFAEGCDEGRITCFLSGGEVAHQAGDVRVAEVDGDCLRLDFGYGARGHEAD